MQDEEEEEEEEEEEDEEKKKRLEDCVSKNSLLARVTFHK